MQRSAKILLFGLDQDEADLLLAEIPEPEREREIQDLNPGEKGEPATVVIAIALTAAALKAWVAFLAALGKRRSFRHTFQIQHVNGTKETHTIEIIKTDHAELDDTIISKLTDFGVDFSTLANDDPQ